MPSEFVGWKQLNPDWAIQKFDEKAMDTWVETNLATPTDSGLDKSVVLHTRNQLPRRTLKYDMFRYLMIFLKGGVYADPDTSSVLPIAEWGHKGTTKDMTDFRVLQLAADAQNVIHSSSSDSPPTSINTAPPAFIVNSHDTRLSRRRTSRTVCFCQRSPASYFPGTSSAYRRGFSCDGRACKSFRSPRYSIFLSSAVVTRKSKSKGGIKYPSIL